MTDPKPRNPILLGNALAETVPVPAPDPAKAALPAPENLPPSPFTNQQMWALGPRACAERWHALQGLYETVLAQVEGDEEQAEHLFGPFAEEVDVIESMLAALPGETTRRTQFVVEIHTLLTPEAMDFVTAAEVLASKKMGPPPHIVEDFHKHATPLAARIFQWVAEQGWYGETSIEPPEWSISVNLPRESCDAALQLGWRMWGKEIRDKAMRMRLMAVVADVGDPADYPDAWPGDASSEASA